MQVNQEDTVSQGAHHSVACGSVDTSTPRQAGWLDISSAPKNGTIIQVWADGFEWPEAVKWELYDAKTAAEIEEDGYWTYADELLADATDSCGSEDWTHWQPIIPPEDHSASVAAS